MAPVDPLGLLDSLPVDKVPEPGNLAEGSRVVHYPNPAFVGRGEALHQLAKALKEGTAAVINQNAVITGSGGIGKTQLAAEAAWRYGPFFAGGVFWISFADPGAIIAEVAECGLKLRLHPEFSRLAIADQVALVRGYWESAAPCLLIFDNCEDPALFKEWRPMVGRARVLVTSRHATWDGAPKVTALSLSILSRADSLALLGTHRPDLVGQAILEEIAEELGDFPLALHLAGRYLKRYRAAPQGDPARYLEDLRAWLLKHKSLNAGTTETKHEASVAGTFAASVARLEPTDIVDTTALSALTHAAFLAPGEPVPLWLLAKTMGQAEDEDFLARLVDAVARLRDLGLVEVDPEGVPILHRLIAAYARQRAEDRDAVWDAVADAVYEIAKEHTAKGFPEIMSSWLVHLHWVARYVESDKNERAGGVFNCLGFYFEMVGEFEKSTNYYEYALSAWQSSVGLQDSRVAIAFNNLGSSLRERGRYSDAQLACEQALEIGEVTLGSNHSNFAIFVNNLGLTLQCIGDLQGARRAFERALSIGSANTGDRIPEISIWISNLGMVLRDLGELSRARCKLEEALAVGEATFGLQHPQMATFINNFGILLRDFRDFAGAQHAFERAISIGIATLGEQHPKTAIFIYNLGLALHDLRDIEGARVAWKRVLDIRELILGPDHPDTKHVYKSLAALSN